MSSQSKLESHLEATLNILSGFFISLLVWMYAVGPLIKAGYIVVGPAGDALAITAIFTVTSYIRSYVWRRFFSNDIHKAVHAGVKRWIQ